MYQKWIVVGRLGQDPEMKYLEDGTAICSFRVAVNYYAHGQKSTMWVGVTTFEKTAEQCAKNLHKGEKVLCEGRIVPGPGGSPKVFQRKDGTYGSSYEMTATTVTFLGDKAEPSEGKEESHGAPEKEEIDF